MNRLNRRGFLQLAGAVGAAVPVSVALDLAAPKAHATGDASDAHVYYFRAVAGVPELPLPVPSVPGGLR
jgi:hypothetical protein